MPITRAMTSILVLGVAALAMWNLATAAPEGRSAAPTTSQTQADKPSDAKKDLSHFMRLKLEASGKILEGLAVEDFGLIKEGATQLHEMSGAEKWRVTNDALYRNFSGDFQRVTKELMEAAEKENLDRAALKWMDATLSCIECHRYARGILIAAADPAGGTNR